MQYDVSFLLYQLQYLADYEERTTVENVTFWSHNANNSPCFNAVQLQLVTLKCCRTRKEYKSGRNTEFLPQGSPSIPSLPDLLQTSNSYTSTLPFCHRQYLKLVFQWTNVVGSIFRTTRRNQDLDMELKSKIAETYKQETNKK